MRLKRATGKEDWCSYRRELERWRDTYIEYLAAGQNSSQSLRVRLDSLTAAADQALKVGEHEVAAPSVSDSGFDRSLAGTVVWMHDRGHWPSRVHSEVLLDTVNQAIETLSRNEQQMQERS
jgi:hypothetical protein